MSKTAVRLSESPFDSAAAWAALTPEAQARIGAAALDMAVLLATTEHAPDPAARAAHAIMPVAECDLRDAVLETLPEPTWWSAADRGVSTIRLPATHEQICLVCGCSDRDACDEGCSWHTAVLCTACSGPAVAPKSLSHAIVQARLIETSHRIRDQRGLPRLAGEEILGRAPPPAPDLAPEDVRAVCRGACRAVAESELADVPPPSGDGLAALASAIDRMHQEERNA